MCINFKQKKIKNKMRKKTKRTTEHYEIVCLIYYINFF